MTITERTTCLRGLTRVTRAAQLRTPRLLTTLIDERIEARHRLLRTATRALEDVPNTQPLRWRHASHVRLMTRPRAVARESHHASTHRIVVHVAEELQQ